MGTGTLITVISAHSESIKDFSTIIFSLVATFIAILTYINARKTLFQPVRSEVIKKQTELLTDMLQKLFNERVEHNVDYQGIIGINTFLLMDECGFITKDHEQKKERVLAAHAGDRLYANKDGVLDEYVSVQTFGQKDLSEAELKEAKKKKYDAFKEGKFPLNRIRLTPGFQNYMDSLQAFLKNPFLPFEICKILEKLIAEINYNLDNPLKESLKKFLLDLRTKQPGISPDTALRIESSGVFNDFNHVRADHEPTCLQLRQCIRKYLRIDEKW